MAMILFIKAMKTITSTICLLFIIIFFTQCKKESTSTVVDNPITVTKDYSPVTAGSTFTYSDSTNDLVTSFSMTATGINSTLYGKTYSKLSTSNGNTFYRAKSGAKYYQLTSYPSMSSNEFENVYLIDSLPVNSTWTVPFKILNVLGFPDSLNAVATYKISEKGISRAVEGRLYTNVIHVSLIDVSAYSAVPPSGQLAGAIASGDFYFALGVGLIQGRFEVEDVSSFGISSYKSSQILSTYNIK